METKKGGGFVVSWFRGAIIIGFCNRAHTGGIYTRAHSLTSENPNIFAAGNDTWLLVFGRYLLKVIFVSNFYGLDRTVAAASP